MSRNNPCLKCGACCAFFRVSFYWGETDLYPGGGVPADFTERLTDFRQCMKGTNQKKPFCAALEGEIGKSVRCAIYADRPSPCREFGVIWENDTARFNPESLKRCNKARAAWGLAPLSYHLPYAMAHRVAVRLLLSVHAPFGSRLSGRLTHTLRDPKRSRDHLPYAPGRAGQKRTHGRLFI